MLPKSLPLWCLLGGILYLSYVILLHHTQPYFTSFFLVLTTNSTSTLCFWSAGFSLLISITSFFVFLFVFPLDSDEGEDVMHLAQIIFADILMSVFLLRIFSDFFMCMILAVMLLIRLSIALCLVRLGNIGRHQTVWPYIRLITFIHILIFLNIIVFALLHQFLDDSEESQQQAAIGLEMVLMALCSSFQLCCTFYVEAATLFFNSLVAQIDSPSVAYERFFPLVYRQKLQQQSQQQKPPQQSKSPQTTGENSQDHVEDDNIAVDTHNDHNNEEILPDDDDGDITNGGEFGQAAYQSWLASTPWWYRYFLRHSPIYSFFASVAHNHLFLSSLIELFGALFGTCLLLWVLTMHERFRFIHGFFRLVSPIIKLVNAHESLKNIIVMKHSLQKLFQKLSFRDVSYLTTEQVCGVCLVDFEEEIEAAYAEMQQLYDKLEELGYPVETLLVHAGDAPIADDNGAGSAPLANDNVNSSNPSTTSSETTRVLAASGSQQAVSLPHPIDYKMLKTVQLLQSKSISIRSLKQQQLATAKARCNHNHDEPHHQQHEHDHHQEQSHEHTIGSTVDPLLPNNNNKNNSNRHDDDNFTSEDAIAQSQPTSSSPSPDTNTSQEIIATLEALIVLESQVSQIGVLCCGHYFHQECITEWLNRNSHCPVCRTKCQTKSSRNVFHLQNRQKVEKRAIVRLGYLPSPQNLLYRYKQSINLQDTSPTVAPTIDGNKSAQQDTTTDTAHPSSSSSSSIPRSVTHRFVVGAITSSQYFDYLALQKSVMESQPQQQQQQKPQQLGDTSLETSQTVLSQAQSNQDTSSSPSTLASPTKEQLREQRAAFIALQRAQRKSLQTHLSEDTPSSPSTSPLSISQSIEISPDHLWKTFQTQLETELQSTTPSSSNLQINRNLIDSEIDALVRRQSYN